MRALGTLLLAGLLVLPVSASARWYDAGTGRFLSEDPLLGDILQSRKDLSNPASLHPWLYANGNPLRYVDPDGRDADTAGSTVEGMCALWGEKLSFCQSSEAMQQEVDAQSRSMRQGSVAGASFTLGWAGWGLRGAIGLWALGTTLDVAKQTYEDPSRPKTLDGLDMAGAVQRGALMCAMPPAMRGVAAMGGAGKAFVGVVTLYMGGEALGEGMAQCMVGAEQGDLGRAIYGASEATLGLSGAWWGGQELAQSIPPETVARIDRYLSNPAHQRGHIDLKPWGKGGAKGTYMRRKAGASEYEVVQEDPFGNVTAEGLRSRPSTSPVYSVLAEAQLTPGVHYPGVPDRLHFAEANRQLYEAFRADPSYAARLERLYPGITKGVQPGAKGAFPQGAPTPDVTWHHVPDKPGLMQLVPYEQHTAAGAVQQSLHPEGRGGMEKWGGGR